MSVITTTAPPAIMRGDGASPVPSHTQIGASVVSNKSSKLTLAAEVCLEASFNAKKDNGRIIKALIKAAQTVPLVICDGPIISQPEVPEISEPRPITSSKGKWGLWRNVTKVNARAKATPSPQTAPAMAYASRAASPLSVTANVRPTMTRVMAIHVAQVVDSSYSCLASNADQIGTVATPSRTGATGASEIPIGKSVVLIT